MVITVTVLTTTPPPPGKGDSRAGCLYSPSIWSGVKSICGERNGRRAETAKGFHTEAVASTAVSHLQQANDEEGRRLRVKCQSPEERATADRLSNRAASKAPSTPLVK